MDVKNHCNTSFDKLTNEDGIIASAALEDAKKGSNTRRHPAIWHRACERSRPFHRCNAGCFAWCMNSRKFLIEGTKPNLKKIKGICRGSDSQETEGCHGGERKCGERPSRVDGLGGCGAFRADGGVGYSFAAGSAVIPAGVTDSISRREQLSIEMPQLAQFSAFVKNKKQ
jgi:hypothetical protein